MIVEGELLRIAQAAREHFQIRSIHLAAQHHSFIGINERLSFARDDVEPAIANAEIKPPIGPDTQTMQVVTEECDVHTESGMERLPRVGFVVCVRRAKQPKIRDTTVINLPVAREDTSANSIGRAIKAFRKDS